MYLPRTHISGEMEDVSDIRSVKSSDDAESGHMDMITKLRSRKERRFTTSWGPEGFKNSRHPLSIMVCTYTCTQIHCSNRCASHWFKGAIARAFMYVELTHSQPKVATRASSRLSHC